MAFVQLFKLATIKTSACRAAGNHPIITVKYDLEKGVRDIEGLSEVSSTRFCLIKKIGLSDPGSSRSRAIRTRLIHF